MKKEGTLRNGRRKLWVEVPAPIYDRLQLHAKKRNIHFSKYINRILLRYILTEEKYEN